MPASGRSSAEAEADRSARRIRRSPEFRYVEEFVRYQLAQSLGGVRGMIESALPFVAFTIAWVIGRQLYPALGAALGIAVLLGIVRLVQRQSLRYVLTAVIPTAIAAVIATRTGRAEDVFLPGILYNGALAVLSLVTVAVRRPLVGFVIGAAVGDPDRLDRRPRAGPDDREADPGAGGDRTPCGSSSSCPCSWPIRSSGSGSPRLPSAGHCWSPPSP